MTASSGSYPANGSEDSVIRNIVPGTESAVSTGPPSPALSKQTSRDGPHPIGNSVDDIPAVLPRLAKLQQLGNQPTIGTSQTPVGQAAGRSDASNSMNSVPTTSTTTGGNGSSLQRSRSLGHRSASPGQQHRSESGGAGSGGYPAAGLGQMAAAQHAFGMGLGGGAFTPMESASPMSVSPTNSNPSSRRGSFASVNAGSGGTVPIVAPHPMASGPASPFHSNTPSRRGSFAHPNASGPRPPMRRRDSLAAGEDPAPPTPSLLSRAGSPTLPLMNEKTASRSSSRRGSFATPGFGNSGLEMSGMIRGSKREGEFIGAVDCGTTSTRFIVFDKYAKIICEDQREFQQHWPHPGWHEHEPMDLINSVNECISAAVEKLEFLGFSKSSIKAIGITNQRETTLCWDKTTGKPLCRAMVWDDARTVGVVRDFQKKLDEEGLPLAQDEVLLRRSGGSMAAPNGKWGSSTDNAKDLEKKMQDLKAEQPDLPTPTVETDSAISGDLRRRKGKEALVDITGIPLSTYFSAIKLRWMLDHYPEVKKASDEDRLAFGTVDSWLVYQLTGAEKNGLHVMDCTNASRTLLMSLKTRQWYPPLLEFFDIKSSVLPKIVSSSEVYGKVHQGPLQGVPIAGMIGDQQAALVGNKCLSRGEAKCTYGTGAFVLFNTGHEPVRSGNGLITTLAYQLGPDSPPTYALEGSIAVAGSAIKWLRDQIGLIDESSEMDILCSGAKDNGGVYFVTGFSGLLAPYWDPNAAGMIIGLTQYSTSAHVARATIEAVCFQTRAVLAVIEQESGVKSEELKVDGGVTNSDLAMQTQADIGGFRVCRPYMRESTALGSALLAASAVRLFGWDLSKPETLTEVNTEESTIFEPQITDAKRQKMVRGWERAVERAKAWHTAEEEDEAEDEYEKSGKADGEEVNTIG